MNFNLIALRVSSIETSRTFYERLGLRFELHQHGGGPQHYAAELDGFVFELYPMDTGTPLNPVRIGLQVASLDAIVAAFARSEILSPARESQWGRRLVLLDPDRNPVELLVARA